MTVDKIVAGGAGFGRRTNGEPVFVRGALPGDRVRLRLLGSERGYSRAIDWSIEQAGPERRTPPCPYASRCGGCDLMALDPAAQRRAKHELVVETMKRTAHVDVSSDSALSLTWDEPARDDLGYRSRIRVHIDHNAQLGFLANQSHELVPIKQCQVASRAVNQMLEQLQAVAAAYPEHILPFRAVEIRALGAAVDLAFFPRDEPPAGTSKATSSPTELALEGIKGALVGAHSDVLIGAHPDLLAHWRTNVQAVKLGEQEQAPALLFAPGAFTQVNWHVNQQIVAHLLNCAQARKHRTFADLYCGAGNFSLPLLAAGLEGCGVETSALSVSLLRLSSQRQGLGGVFSAEPVRSATQRWLREKRKFDLIVIDPPRAGFKEAVSQVADLAGNSIFMCACDPVTFARDLRSLLDQGFRLESLRAFDMFPQTHHMELTAWLSRRGDEGAA